jgi:hypothetical protein
MSDLRTGHVRVTDRREVVVEIADAPLVYTPKGRSPIRPTRVLATITYGFLSPGARHIQYEVWGQRVDGDKQGDYLRRSYSTHTTAPPDWVRDVIEPHAAGSGLSGHGVESADGVGGEQRG